MNWVIKWRKIFERQCRLGTSCCRRDAFCRLWRIFVCDIYTIIYNKISDKILLWKVDIFTMYVYSNNSPKISKLATYCQEKSRHLSNKKWILGLHLFVKWFMKISQVEISIGDVKLHQNVGKRIYEKKMWKHDFFLFAHFSKICWPTCEYLNFQYLKKYIRILSLVWVFIWKKILNQLKTWALMFLEMAELAFFLDGSLRGRGGGKTAWKMLKSST